MLRILKIQTAVIILLFAITAVSETLFQIKDEVGNPVLVVSSDGLVILNSGDTLMVIGTKGIKAFIENDPTKGLSRSFSVTTSSTKSGASDVLNVTTDGLNVFDQTGASKALGDTLMTISSKSIKAHITSGAKGLSRSFSVTTSSTKSPGTRVLEVSTDSTAMREGSGVDYSNFSPKNIFLGSQAGISITEGKYNLFFGNKAGYSTRGDYNVQDSLGSYNLFAGHESGYSNIQGKNNIYLGFQSGYVNETGEKNVFIGYQSGYNCTESYNTFIGDKSGISSTSGTFNVFMGGNSGMQNDEGYSNTFIGYSAGYRNVNGDCNTSLGLEAGSKYGGTGNTSIGYRAGSAQYLTETDYNTCIGFSAGDGNKGGGNVFLGANAGTFVNDEYKSNRLMIANSYTAAPLIYGSFPNNYLALNADSVKIRALVSGSGSPVYRNATTGLLVASSSDRRLKENITPLENGLDKILQLQGVSYSWKSDENHDKKIGLIAQDVEKVLPELVFTNEADGYKGINYAEITAVLIEAVKELKKTNTTEAEENKKIIDSQNDKIGILINENKELKNEVSELKNLKAEIEMLKKHITGYANK